MAISWANVQNYFKDVDVQNEIGAFGVAAQAIGGLSSVLSSYNQAKATKSALEYQGQMADINADMQEIARQSRLLSANTQIAALTMKAGQLRARQNVAVAANNLTRGVGNAAELAATAKIMKDVDVHNIKTNAILASFGPEIAKLNSMAQGRMARVAADSVNKYSIASASLLATATQVTKSYYDFTERGGTFTRGG